MATATTSLNQLARAGRLAGGAAATGLGLMQVANAEFVRLVPAPPAWWPETRLSAVGLGLALLLSGVGLLTGHRQRPAALTLAGLLLASFLLQRVPEILANPGAGYVWTNPAKVLALLGGAWLLAGETGRGRSVAALLPGVFLLLGGAQHLAYAGFVDTLVPAWLPPGPRFWTVFTAGALLAGGAGMLVPATRRLAGLLAGLMILLWVPLVHLPRAFETRSAFELAGALEALALAGVAWLVAAEEPGRPAARDK